MRKFTVISTLLLLITLGVSQSKAQDYLFAGIYAPSNAAIRYSGVWTVVASTTIGVKTQYQTVEQYAAFEFMFYGTSFSFHSRSNTGWGDAQVCIDITCTTQSLASGSSVPATYTSSTGSLGWHTGRVRLDTAAGGTTLNLYYLTIISTSATVPVAVTNFPTAIPVQSVSITNVPSVVITSIPPVSVTNMPTVQAVEVNNFPDSYGSEALRAGFYDDRDARLTFSGDFVRNTADAFSFDTYTSFHTALDYVSFPVIGDKLTIYLSAQPTRVNMRIYIDGVYQNYELGSDTPNERFPVEILFPYGYHLIKVEHRTTSFEVKVDGVLVHEPAESVWMVGDTSVQVDYRITSGDIALAMLAFAILCVAVVFLSLNLLGVRKPRD